jgi:hypothetical protein
MVLSALISFGIRYKQGDHNLWRSQIIAIYSLPSTRTA